MRITPESGGVSLVLVGNFNPIIFRPEWLKLRELVPSQEIEEAKVDVIHPELSAFSLGWARVKVEPTTLIIESTEDPFVRTRDLISKVFVEQLPHTPIAQVAINRMAHFKLASRAVMDSIGFKLAPVEPWGEWASDIMSGEEKHGGVRSITMEQSFVEDRAHGYIRATVQPSIRVVPGVWIEVNDHYVIYETGIPEGALKAIGVLEEHFDKSIARSEWIMDQVLRLV